MVAKVKTIAFFDRNVIKRNWSKINKTPITKAGLLVRRIARGSIRRGKKGGKPRPPGQPPKSRVAGKTPPFKMIFSIPNNKGTKATVGMVGFNTAEVPGMHEHGGDFMGYLPEKIVRKVKGRGGRHRKKTTIKINKSQRVRIKIPKRPFMQPALEKAKPRLNEMWRNSMKGQSFLSRPTRIK